MIQKVKRAVCHFCHSKCRLLIYSEDGRFVKYVEEPDTPMAGTTQPLPAGCLRARGIKEFMEHPDRLSTRPGSRRAVAISCGFRGKTAGAGGVLP